MPVFHTKTIESILEPVAEQVSQLVILHEKGEEGAAMPPLEQPINSVKAAVTNLATIGQGQIATTRDEVLKLDTPAAICSLQEAADLLVDAAKTLDADNLSKEGREKLITGARGILHGTSDLLLVFDGAEVRRICHVCQSVRDYLQVSKVVQQMDDLLTFVKNLTPGLTSLTKLVTQRSNDLTNRDHSQKLLSKVDTIKVRLPNLISSMKAYVTIFAETGNDQSGLNAANENREFYVHVLSDDITDTIHLLQLVSTDKEMEMDKVDMIALNVLNNNVVKNAQLAKQWLQDSCDGYSLDNEGQLAIYKMVSDARTLGDEVQGLQGEKLFKKCDSILDSLEHLKYLHEEGKVDGPEALQLKQELQKTLDELLNEMKDTSEHLKNINEARNTIVTNTPIVKEWLLDPSAKSSAKVSDAYQQLKSAVQNVGNELNQNHPSENKTEKINQLCEEIDESMNKMVELRDNNCGHTTEARELGKQTANKIVMLNNAITAAVNKPMKLETLEVKMNEIEKWLEDPDINDGGQGMIAASSLIASVYGIAGKVKDAEIRKQMIHDAVECDKLCKELNELQRSGLGDSPQAHKTANILKSKFAEVKEAMKDALVEAVADDFSETSVIMKQFKRAAMSAKNVPNRELIFENSSLDLQNHTARLATLSQQAVSISELGAEGKLENVKNIGHQLSKLTPQLINAGKVVLAFPENKQAKDHFTSLCNEWNEHVDQLTEQVDDAMDVSKFIKASKKGIELENEKCLNAMHDNEPVLVLTAAGNIARRAQRVLMAGKREVENTDEECYVKEISGNLQAVNSTINPILEATRSYVQNPSSKDVQDEVSTKNNSLLQEISKVQQCVENRAMEENMRAVHMIQQDTSDEKSDSALSETSTLTVADGMKLEEQNQVPPRPPLPEDEELPPRPPLPEEEIFPEEEEEDDHQMMHAARELHDETSKWETKGNDLISAAKQMALLMAKMSRLVRDEEGKKSDMIACAKEIAKGSSAITTMSMAIAEKCTDKRIRNDMKRTLDKIPTISTQLRILSTVKAASLGDKDEMTKEEEDAAEQATEMLVLNAQNLMMSVKEAVQYAEAASIRIRSDAAGTVRWVRKHR